MKQPRFVEGVLVAIFSSIGGTVLFTSLTLLFSATYSAHIVVSFITTLYLGYLLWRSPKKTGRISAAAFGFFTLFATWLIQPSFSLFILIHVGLISLIRSLAYYRTLLASGADFMLSSLSVAVAFWAYLNSNSLLLTLWSLFLVQALFSTIPTTLTHTPSDKQSRTKERFNSAHRTAEAALNRLSNRF